MSFPYESSDRQYVRTADGLIHLYADGEGDAVALLHQSPSSGRMWEAVLPVFARRGYRAIAFDMPGFGYSDDTPGKQDMAYYARRIAEALALLGHERYSVIGHHTGATVAAQMAADFPDRVKSIALWGYPIFDDKTMQMLIDEEPWELAKDGDWLKRSWERRMTIGSHATGELTLRATSERLQSRVGGAWAHNAVGLTDHVALAKRVRQPVLFMTTESDLGFPFKDEAVSHFPNGSLSVMSGMAVDVADQDPDGFVDAIDGFFRK